MAIEWVEIIKFGKDPIGAIGFIGNDAVAVAAYYDDLDGNKDKKVSATEWVVGKISPIKLDGSAVVEVAMQARVDMDVMMRDPSFGQMAMRMFHEFGMGLIKDGFYATYFKRGITVMSKGAAKHLVSGTVKEFAVRKGMEKAVREAFNGVVSR